VPHFVDRAIGAMVRVWLSSSSNSWRRLPRPVDEPRVHAPGDDADRVLIVGSGIAVSYGVLSHSLGLGGHFARHLSERTGRGSDVELVVDSHVDARVALEAIERARPARFDAIVLFVGGVEAIQLRRASQWRRDLDAVLDLIETQSPDHTETFVVAVPPTGRVVQLPFYARRAVERRVDENNREAMDACAGRRCATFLPFEPRLGDLMSNHGRSTYEEWGSIIATGVADRFEANTARRRAVESIDELDRASALGALGVIDGEDDARLMQITDSARALFGVASASINFIDGHRQWVRALAGDVRDDVPRTDAICDVTIVKPGALVINDALAHPRFRDLPMVREGRVRFYAGHPIEAPNGMRVGALCLTDPTPRAFDRSDEALLRELALRVQAVLRHGAAA
jgi:GAF domain-containing protein